MPKVVEVPGLGNVEFPDSMSDQDVSAQIQKTMAAKQQPATPPEKPGALSRLASGIYETSAKPIVDTVTNFPGALAGLGKQIIGKDDLDSIANAVKSGDYSGAALHLGKWALSRTPEGMAVNTGYSLMKPAIENVKQGNYAGAF